MTDHTDDQKRNRAALVLALESAGATFKGNAYKCVHHSEDHPSAGIFEKGGLWYFKCQSCGAHGDVFDARAHAENRPVADVLRDFRQRHQPTDPAPRRPAPAPPATPTAPRRFATLDDLRAAFTGQGAVTLHTYSNPETRAPELVVVRIDLPEGGKKIIQARPAEGGFELKAPEGPMPIYNRARVAATDEVLIVEGEKCVERLQSLGVVATTSPGGAGKASRADWRPLAGKRCYLWPDHDAPKNGKCAGAEHMNEVAAILAALNPPAEVRMIDPAEWGIAQDGGDVCDFLDDPKLSTGDADAIQCVKAAARRIGGADPLALLVEDSIAGRRRNHPWPWPTLSRMTRSLLPQTITVLIGEPGAGKSLFLLESMLWWRRCGIECAYFAVEEDAAFHLNRAWAMLAMNAELTDPDRLRARPDAARAALDDHRAALDDLAPRITAAPDRAITYPAVLEWLQKQATAGVKIAAIDPVSAIATREPWSEDTDFMMRAGKIVRDARLTLVLATHNKKAQRPRKPGLDDMAGGAAFGRFSQCAIWLNRPDRAKEMMIATPAGDCRQDVNRMVRVVKCRNGEGAGMELAFRFDRASLRFEELGPIVDDDPPPMKEVADPFADAPAEPEGGAE